jgi:hypothetical protein
MTPSRRSLGGSGLLGLFGLAGLAATGCPSPDGNPRVLWLSPVGFDETRVQLVDTEPHPF